MYNKLIFILVAALVVYLSIHQAQGLGCSNCPPGNECCGNSSYDPFYNACIDGQLVNNCVPGACGNAACCPVNGDCYNPIHAQCTNEGIVVKCLGIPSNDPSVCNGHGACKALNTCVCSGGWSGYNCETPPS